MLKRSFCCCDFNKINASKWKMQLCRCWIRCSCNLVNFLYKITNRHPITWWSGSDMEYLFLMHYEQYGCHFADGIFKHIVWNENVCIFIETSLQIVHKSKLTDNESTSVQEMGLLKLFSLIYEIFHLSKVPDSLNSIHIWQVPAFVQIMAWHLSCNKPLSEPMLV